MRQPLRIRRAMLLLATLLGGCSIWREAPEPEPLPPLPIGALGTRPVRLPPPAPTPIEERRITLSAAGTNAGDLLRLLAEAAGASIVLSPEVAAKTVTVYLQDVPASVALAMVLEQVHDQPAGTVPAVIAKPVFYDLPVNVNSAGATAISLRFRTSSALANWIVASRVRILN
ncbi:MAG: hypothetical protein ACT4O1_09585 [Gemmatimonadota bacterium]